MRVRAAMVVVPDGRVLLVRHEKAGHTYWLLPGGGVDEGESVADAARRELLEEVSLDVETGPLLYVAESIAPDGSRHVLHVAFLGRERERGAIQVGKDKRLRGASFFSADELAGLDLRPPLASWLANGLRSGFEGVGQFLGNHWVPEAS